MATAAELAELKAQSDSQAVQLREQEERLKTRPQQVAQPTTEQPVAKTAKAGKIHGQVYEVVAGRPTTTGVTRGIEGGRVSKAAPRMTPHMGGAEQGLGLRLPEDLGRVIGVGRPHGEGPAGRGERRAPPAHPPPGSAVPRAWHGPGGHPRAHPLHMGLVFLPTGFDSRAWFQLTGQTFTVAVPLGMSDLGKKPKLRPMARAQR